LEGISNARFGRIIRWIETFDQPAQRKLVVELETETDRNAASNKKAAKRHKNRKESAIEFIKNTEKLVFVFTLV
jgi:plasmid stabilization system protein ParE